MKLPALVVALFITARLFAQEVPHPKADSLQILVDEAKDDSTKFNLMQQLFAEYVLFDDEKATALAKEELALAEKLKNPVYLETAYDAMARQCWANGDLPASLSYLQKRLESAEKRNSPKDVANSYNNMGNVYRGMKDLDNALESFQKAQQIREEINDSTGMGASLANIGIIYAAKNELRTALTYYLRSRDIRAKIRDERNLAISYNNISAVYLKLDDPDSARPYIDSSLVLYRKFDDRLGMASGYNNLGSAYRMLGQLDLARTYQDSAIRLARKISKPEIIRSGYSELALIEEAAGSYKAAAEWLHRTIALNDSMYNEKMSGQFAEMDAKYKGEKQRRENDRLKAEATREAAVKKLLYVLIALGVAVAGLFFYAYRSKRRSNILLAGQNAQIESQKQEITDSITYARRIQQAILPPPRALQKQFPQSFTLYLPKAIVSGDFWWLKESPKSGVGGPKLEPDSELRTSNFELLLAVGDCTGHGVPGAFMSMLGVDKLTELAQQYTRPGPQLSRLNRAVKETLHVGGEMHEDGVRDGMDVALLAFSVDRKSALFAGANRPLWICSATKEWREIKPTKAAIAGHTDDAQQFEEQTIPFAPGDTLYLFTDGFADQFGGSEGKKLMTKRMREWLTELQPLTMEKQQQALALRFAEWKGEKEQVDDVLVIGIRV